MLLMHFLDNVFPLQYPMYKPGILEGGRGWLLNLLLRTKPFYHAALALSAYHRRSVMLAKVSHLDQITALLQQKKHHEICMNLVHQSAQECSPNIGLGNVASMVQSVFVEVPFNLKVPISHSTDNFRKASYRLWRHMADKSPCGSKYVQGWPGSELRSFQSGRKFKDDVM